MPGPNLWGTRVHSVQGDPLGVVIATIQGSAGDVRLLVREERLRGSSYLLDLAALRRDEAGDLWAVPGLRVVAAAELEEGKRLWLNS